MNYIAIDYSNHTVQQLWRTNPEHTDYEYFCTDPAFFKVQEHTEDICNKLAVCE